MPVQPARPRISTTRADAAPEHRREGEDQQDAGDRGEDVVEPLEEVADLAAEEAAEARRARCRSAWPRSAASTPTKTEICAPLTALASTSRPSRSPPNGSVSALDGLGGLELGGALGPFLVARRQRVDRRQVDVRALRALRSRRWPRRGARARRRSAARWARRPRAASRRPPGRAPAASDQQQEGQRRSPARPCRRGRRVKRRQAACQTPSRALRRRGAPSAAVAAPRSFQHHPRIDQLVEHVGRAG